MFKIPASYQPLLN